MHRSVRQARKRRDAGTDTGRHRVSHTGGRRIKTNRRRGGNRRRERYTRGCGWGGVGDGSPCDGLEFLDASKGVVRRVGFSWSPDQEGMPEYGGMCQNSSAALPRPTFGQWPLHPESLGAQPVYAQQSFRRSWSLVDFCGARLSFAPPPPPLPLSPYNRTCPNILPPNRRVFSWSPCSPSPRRSPLSRTS